MDTRTYYKADIIEALIPKKDTTKSSDVYVKILVEGHPPQKTKVVRELDGKAVWNEHFMLPIDMETQLEIKQSKRNAFFKHGSRSLGKVKLDVASILGQPVVAVSQDVRLNFPSAEVLHNDASQQGYILVRLHRPEEHVQLARSSVAKSFSVLISQLDTFVQIVGAASQIARNQLDRDKRIGDLTDIMEDVYTFVDDVKNFPSRLVSQEEIIKKIMFQTIECMLFIQEYSGHGFCGRALNKQWAEEQITRFTQTFTMLKASFNTGVGVQIALIAHRMYEDVQSIVQTQSLAKLHPVDMDDPSRPACLPQTRSDLLSSVFSWAMNPSSNQNVLWLHGPAGSGKSTIATTIANIARDLGRLGAFVFFNRRMAERNNPAAVVRTLAFQLGEFDHRLGAAISTVIKSTPSIRQSPLRQQFHKLLVQPLSESDLVVWSQEGPVIVCGHVGDREDLLSVLALESVKLPPTLRIVITSRTELDIQEALEARKNICSTPIDINSPANDKDIHLYLHDRLQNIGSKNKYLSLPQEWPGNNAIDALAARARGLFIWAFTACRYVEDGQNPQDRLAALDLIYTTALESATSRRWKDPEFSADFRDILGVVIAARNPLTALTIDRLNEVASVSRPRPSLHTIQHLGCVLRGTTSEPIQVIHPSFEDFLTDRARCKRDEWFIDVSLSHQRLVRQCIGSLRATLKQNMCNLTLTKSRVDFKKLPEDVAYSCIFWIEHVCELEGSEESLSSVVYDFLVKHLLHWIEAMSLLKKARHTIKLLMRLEDWSRSTHGRHQELRKLLADAVRFCQAFTAVIEQHPLLVYSSALPFSPTDCVLYQLFKDELSIPVVAGGFRDEWSPLLMDIPRPGGEVTSLSLSPDGSQLISTIARGCYVWDIISGELLIQGPKGDVAMTVFAPCGQLAASCLFSGSILLWDTFSGKMIGQPLKRDQGAIYALAFSPDGTRLISGGQSCTIIMWNVQVASVVLAPPATHTKTVLCLAFSPDGLRYASGSRDGTIRIWDAASGEMVLEPFRGHSGGVYSVAFTPDSTRIVSGSDDKHVCVWDVQADSLNRSREESMPIKLCGHHSTVFSVAVSPDGRLIASASKDTTVRLWSLESREELSHLVRQHRMRVHCVAFLQQYGRLRLVTGASDATVRIWDTESVGSMGVVRKHKGLVSHLAFSQDGQRIVSGSLDRTVRVWDPMTGQRLLGPLKLEQPVHSVALPADNVRILAADREGAVFAWDATTGEHLPATPADDPSHHSIVGPLSLEGKWIVESRTGTVLTMLPTMSPVRSHASFGNCMALGLANGGIVIVHFPGTPQLV
ncbi:hypothetical protein BD769DRAFT_1500468 [Suillus cothurnatus]|nr:hypothetical protein BD769DRAFT_1500468 [Suillus cothurnatus]